MFRENDEKVIEEEEIESPFSFKQID